MDGRSTARISHRLENRGRRGIVFVLALLTFGASTATVSAGVVSTPQAIEMQARAGDLARVDAFLTRRDVRDQLVARGIDPHDAAQRVAALTDAELRYLAKHIDELPAGAAGVVEVIGIVAIVLIILELLGVTNVFTRI